MASVRAIDSVGKQVADSEISNVVATPSAAPTVDTTPALASRATVRTVSASSSAPLTGLATPAVARSTAGTSATPDKATLAQYAGMDIDQRAATIAQMVNSCGLLGLGCVSRTEESQIVAILNMTSAAQRPQLIAALASRGVLDDLVSKLSTNDSQMLRNYIRTNIGGLRDPVIIASTLGRIDIYSDAEVIAIAHSLRAQLGDAQADQVLQMLVAQGMLSRPLPFMSPLYLYSNCDSFWGVLQQQQMSSWLEQQRTASRLKLEAVLSAFPPNSIAASQLRAQFDTQYTIERVNDQIATMSCLAQPRYRTYYQSNYPTWYNDWYSDYGYRYRSGDGFGYPSTPRSGDGFGSSSGDGFGSRSGDGFGSNSGDGFGSGSSSAPWGGSGDGFGGSTTSPSYSGSGSGDGFGSSSPSYSPPSYTPPSYNGSGDGFGSSSPSYSSPSYSPPSYTPPSYNGSGDGFGSSSRSYSPPSYSTPSYSSPSYSGSGSGDGFGGGSYGGGSYSSGGGSYSGGSSSGDGF